VFSLILIRFAKRAAKQAISLCQRSWLVFPASVECNMCHWKGRRFLSDGWHKHITCPKCHASLRHRLLAAALQHGKGIGFADLARNRDVLHFAAESQVVAMLKPEARRYVRADLTNPNADVSLDITYMPSVADESFDLVIACDVLEHVDDFRQGVREIRRVLTPGGYAILTVPQKDGLLTTHEDPTITSPNDRERVFGQSDHLRIFGDDFPDLVTREGFNVVAFGPESLRPEVVARHVLIPPFLSPNPLATNNRKVFFCQKQGE